MSCYPPPGTSTGTIHVLSQDLDNHRRWEHAIWNDAQKVWFRYLGEHLTGDFADTCNATWHRQLTNEEADALGKYLREQGLWR